MIFSISIHSPPSSQASYSALQFAHAALKQKHTIYRVFFYHDGVYQASDLICSPQGEFDVSGAWDELKTQFNLDLVVCIAAGLKRGIINNEEKDRYEKNSANLNNQFELSGLGQLIDAAVMSDRLLTFGG